MSRSNVGHAAFGLAGEQDDAEIAAPPAGPAGSSGSMAMQPLTWKPPITTGTPAARNWRPRSSARGNWLDCTPTSADQAAAGGADALARWPLDIDDGVALVVGLDLDIDVGAEHAGRRAHSASSP